MNKFDPKFQSFQSFNWSEVRQILRAEKFWDDYKAISASQRSVSTSFWIIIWTDHFIDEVEREVPTRSKCVGVAIIMYSG